ncbi:uncharacterized protein [Typha latifolia]|uniref:uncharacterized protein n=1 Tax=Typha latifolia TaxID=4733 RepID=UPI003C2FDDFA
MIMNLPSNLKENIELKQKLLSLSVELETLRANADREINKKEQLIDELVNLLRTTMQERDEAKVYLQLLQSYYQPDQSSSVYQPGSYYSHICSPEMSSIVNIIALPELPSMTMADSVGLIASQQPPAPVGLASGTVGDVFDQLAARKPLAERGKLLQAVMEAGPLLESVMIAGPLPRWHNPPPALIGGGGYQTLSHEPRGFGCMN